MPAAPPVRPATTADVPAMAHALSLAFADDPVMAWLFGDDERRTVRGLRRYFAVEGRRHLRHHQVFTTGDHAGASYWDPPGHWRSRPADLLRLAPVMITAVGPRIRRSLQGLGRIEAVHARFPPHHYLAVLGTVPDRQGTGVGSALIEPILRRCDEDGLGAYLESSKAANIPFYERHGFAVVEELPLPGGPALWPMWRDPRPPVDEA